MSNGASFSSRIGVEPGTGLDEDLVAIGMDYSAIVQLLATVQQEFGVEIDEEDFLSEPTLRRLRRLVCRAEGPEGLSLPSDSPAASPVGLLDDAELRAILREARVEHSIRLDVDLFEQGLTSLKILQILSKARTRTGVQVDLEEFLRRPTMRRLAELHATRVSTLAAGDADKAPKTSSEPEGVEDQRLGMLSTEDEKRAFLSRQHNLRHVDSTARRVEGLRAALDDFAREYGPRESKRAFSRKAVESHRVLGWLACLNGVELRGKHRYLYPSAGSTYCVQVYVEVKPEGIDGIEEGLYYYHPLQHALVKVGAARLPNNAHFVYNRATYEQAMFCLHFVAEYRGIKPIYGRLSEQLLAVETGSIVQLLRERQANYGLAGCVLAGMNDHALREALGLGESQHVLLAMACGSVASLAENPRPTSVTRGTTEEDIAIVALQGRFPGADSLDEYWKNLIAGSVSLSPASLARGSAREWSAEEDLFAGFLRSIHEFDPQFFGISFADAAMMDPQERLLLESTYELLELGGYRGRNARRLTQDVGVFAGVMWNDDRSVSEELQGTCNDVIFAPLSSIANRISYFFDWTGPSLAVDASCASSLTAVHLACESIRRGDCRAAVACGVNLLGHPSHARNLRRLGLSARSRESGAFGDHASGWVPGEGVGAVLLRPLSLAKADRDHIWGVIRSGTISSGGKASRYGAPSTELQRQAMARTLQKGGEHPRAIQYVEAAAAGSAIGDASEILAIQRVFAPRSTRLLVGSVKPNIGHLESASGMSQLAKVLLQFKHGKVAPMAPRGRLNPMIRVDEGPVELVAEGRAWETEEGRPRLAMVNSFGGTGSYASILLASVDDETAFEDESIGRETVFVLSAETREQLRRYTETWLEYLESDACGVSLRAIAETLQFGRDSFPERIAVVALTLEGLRDELRGFLRGEPSGAIFTGSAASDRRATGVTPCMQDESASERARAWVTGSWAWEETLSGAPPQKVPLPTYPLRRRIYVKGIPGIPAPPAHAAATGIPRGGDDAAVVAGRDDRAHALDQAVRRALARQLGVTAEKALPDQSFLEMGLNSMDMVQVISYLQDFTHQVLPPDLLVRCANVGALCAYLHEVGVELARTAKQDKCEQSALAESRVGGSPSANLQHSGKLPLSEGQKGLWILQRLDPESSAYNCPICFRVVTPIAREDLDSACDYLLRRHPVLSATIGEEDGVPFQTVDPSWPVTIDEEDVSAKPIEHIVTRLRTLARVPFHLDAGPPIRVHVLRRSSHDTFVLLIIHHIVFDGNSFIPLVRAFSRGCRALGNPERLMPRGSEMGYFDFVAQEQALLASEEGKRRLCYWKAILAGELPRLDMQTDRNTSPTSRRAGRDSCTRGLPVGLVRQVTDFARKCSVFPSTVFLAVFRVLLFRYTTQEDMIIGMPVDLRRPEWRSSIGFFATMVPIRSVLTADSTFGDFVQRMQSAVLNGLANRYPFPKLVSELGLGGAGRSAVFQTTFGYQGEFEDPWEMDWEMVQEVFQEGEYELSVDVTTREASAFVRALYDVDQYSSARMSRMLEHYLCLLNGLTREPGVVVSECAFLSEEERRTVLLDWNDTKTDIPPACIHELVEAQAKRSPDAIAVAFEGERLTYGELSAKTNQLARYLRKRGVCPDSLVGVCMNRSVELVVALLSVLKAGGAYVPIDPLYPQRRIELMLSEIRSPILLTEAEHRSKLVACAAETLCLQEQWRQVSEELSAPVDPVATPDHLAYVIYTSGSTGKPKGCMLPHSAVSNRLLWMQDAYRLVDEDRVLQKTPFGFDVSVWELFWPLIAGATLVMALPGRHTDPRYLVEVIERSKITVCHFVPSMFRAFVHELEPGRCTSLTRLFCSGESLSRSLLDEGAAKLRAEIHNLYGPTEAAVDVTYWRAHPRPDGTVPIGRPISNCQIYILDAAMQLVPVGVPGELYIGGAGLARGYLNRPDLTSARFVPNPFDREESPRLYRTGDLAAWLPDGNIQYLGRMDHQVKIRGFRIELGEIEACLLEHKDVLECAVSTEDDGNGGLQLAAHLVFEVGRSPSTSELRSFVGAALPEYMIPTRFLALPALPVTSSGKLDRGALSRVPRALPTERFCVKPRTDVEHALAAIWRDLLGIPEIGVHDSFFELGGHSLKVASLVSRVEKKFVGVKIDQLEFYRDPTIGALVRLIASNEKRRLELVPRLLASRGPAELSLICCPYAGGLATVYHPLAEELARLGDRIDIYAVSPPPEEAQAGLDSLERLAEACVAEILAKVSGSIAVYGHCTGSFLGLEIARRLEQEGRCPRVLFVGGAFPFHWGARLLPIKDPWYLLGDSQIRSLMTYWGASTEGLDGDALKQIILRFRRDARMAFVYEKSRARWKISAPIVNIVSVDDKLTKNYSRRYTRWGKICQTVRLFVIDGGEHYFVAKRPDLVAGIIRHVHEQHDAVIAGAEEIVNWKWGYSNNDASNLPRI
jgi:amino acid adenylation domain-containing protein